MQALFILILVWHVRRGTLKTASTVARFGFLFSSYRSQFYWCAPHIFMYWVNRAAIKSVFVGVLINQAVWMCPHLPALFQSRFSMLNISLQRPHSGGRAWFKGPASPSLVTRPLSLRFEVFEVIRKLFLSAVAAFIFAGSPTQVG